MRTVRLIGAALAASMAIAATSAHAPSHPVYAEGLQDSTMTASEVAAAVDRADGDLETIPLDDADINLPDDAAQTLTFSGVSIALPDSASARVVDASSDTAVYTGAFIDTNVAVRAPAAGGVQSLVTIESSDAPTRFEFHLGADDVVVGLAEHADGSVAVVGDDGRDLGVIEPAWALDANGRSVPTHFEVDGSVLTQVVEHDQSVAYPVVADPWWNPFSWNWRMAGRAVVSGLKRCLGGAASTVIPAGVATGSVNVVAKKVTGKIAIRIAGGPWGYAAIGAAGCLNKVIR